MTGAEKEGRAEIQVSLMGQRQVLNPCWGLGQRWEASSSSSCRPLREAGSAVLLAGLGPGSRERGPDQKKYNLGDGSKDQEEPPQRLQGPKLGLQARPRGHRERKQLPRERSTNHG